MDDLTFKKQKLDPKSASFCGAKWYNATIWLGSGQTTSCHHPLPFIHYKWVKDIMFESDIEPPKKEYIKLEKYGRP